MKILHILPYFYPAMAFGGIVRAATDIAIEHAKQGHEVRVITTDILNSDNRIEQLTEKPFSELNLTIYRCKNLSNNLAYNLQLYLPRGIKKLLGDLIPQCDVVHLHGNRNFLNYFAVKVAKDKHKKIIFSPHGTMEYFETKIFLKKVFDCFFNNSVIASIDKFIAVSEKEKDEILKQGIPPEKIELIYNPLNLSTPESFRGDSQGEIPTDFKEKFGLQKHKTIIFLGRLSKTKGLSFFLDVFNAFEGQDIAFIIAGNDMGYKAELTEKLKRQKIPWKDIDLNAIFKDGEESSQKLQGKIVFFTGFIDGGVKNSMLASSDCFVYPSEKEIFGLSPFESIQNGTPVIVSEESGCGEMIKKANCGLTAHYGDVAAWKSSLHQTLNDTESNNEMIQNGQSFLQSQLEVSKVVKKIIDSYKQGA